MAERIGSSRQVIGLSRRVQVWLAPKAAIFGSRTLSGSMITGPTRADGAMRPSPGATQSRRSSSDLRGRMPEVAWTRADGCIRSVSRTFCPECNGSASLAAM